MVRIALESVRFKQPVAVSFCLRIIIFRGAEYYRKGIESNWWLCFGIFGNHVLFVRIALESKKRYPESGIRRVYGEFGPPTEIIIRNRNVSHSDFRSKQNVITANITILRIRPEARICLDSFAIHVGSGRAFLLAVPSCVKHKTDSRN